MRRKHRVAHSLLWIGVCVLLFPAPGFALPSGGDTWIQVDTEHFTLISNAGKGSTVKLGDKLERFRKILAATSLNMTDDMPVPNLIYVFKDSREFLEYSPMRVSGYFMPHREANLVAIDASSSQYALPVIYHEFVHVWVNRNLPGVPLWLNEGMAEFYSTFKIEEGGLAGGRRTVKIGNIHQDHARWLKVYEHLPLEQLLGMDSSSLDYNEQDRTGSFYAQSWALTHSLLMGSDESLERMNQYVVRTSTGGDPVQTFRDVFATDLATAAADLRAYTEAGRYRYWTIELVQAVKVEEARVRELSYDEALCRLGELKASAFPPGTVDEQVHFRSAVEANPRNARAHAWLARVQARAGDRSGADRHRKEAQRLTPDDPEIYWLAATGIEEHTRRSGVDPDDPAGDPWNRASSLYRQALELAPDHYPSIVGLGSSCLFGDDLDPVEGRDLLQRAYAANPSNLEVLVDWIRAEAKAGDLDKAWSLVDTHLRPRGQAEAVRVVEFVLAEHEARAAGELMGEGDREGALLRLQSMMRRTQNPNVREMAMSWGLIVTGQLSGDHNEEVDLYNQVVSLANSGRSEDALVRLRELVPRIQSDHLRTTAENLKERLEAQLRRQGHIDRYNEAVSLLREGELEPARAKLALLVAETPDEPVASRARSLLEQLSRK